MMHVPYAKDILNDPEINCVVELCGGTSTAKEVVWRAIKTGRHVVTANKGNIVSALTQ